ncbi:unnamed protein product [Chilo suppressalis]|uniref:Uncharacterized protein n=1 Tax=Chilo suppressalis TaxID=168631 RepID=A0ABN8AU73_CHISP|nr:unnamed protein product [Chilo suppressalis]
MTFYGKSIPVRRNRPQRQRSNRSGLRRVRVRVPSATWSAWFFFLVKLFFRFKHSMSIVKKINKYYQHSHQLASPKVSTVWLVLWDARVTNRIHMQYIYKNIDIEIHIIHP